MNYDGKKFHRKKTEDTDSAVEFCFGFADTFLGKLLGKDINQKRYLFSVRDRSGWSCDYRTPMVPSLYLRL